jgi:hypothetical protein
MGGIDRRRLVAFVVGAGVAGVAATASTAVAFTESGPPAPRAAAAAPPLVTKACANVKTGAVAVVGAGTRHKRCSKKEKAVSFAPALLASDGSLRLLSPDHRYQLVLSNAGVGMKGPGGTFMIDALRAGGDAGLRFLSPDHRYELVLSNAGVGMTGPGGTYLIDALTAVKLDRSGKVVG